MALVPNFSVSQTPATPSNIVITDTSTGSDVNIAKRRVYVETSQSAFLVPAGVTTNYTPWAYPTPSITLDILTTDQAVNVRVEWLDTFNNVLYQKAVNFCFSQFNQQFFYYLIQVQSQTYNVIQDNRYWTNMATYWANIIGAINAVQIGNDIFGSQTCLNRATFMMNNQLNYF